MFLSLIAPMCCRNHAIKCVLDHTRELLLCFIRKHQFLCAIFGTKFEGKDLNLSIKSVKLKNYISDSNCCQFTLMGRSLSFSRQFLKPLANSNTCIFVNIAWKLNCDILKSKLIFCEWNAFYFIEKAFIGFMLH